MAEELSELQGLMTLVDSQRRAFLLEQLELAEQLRTELSQPVNPIREMQLREGLQIIQNNIQRFRVEGLL